MVTFQGLKMELTIAILYGGKSTEHEVSVHSAGDVCLELEKKYKILPIFISKTGQWFLQKKCGFKTDSDIEIYPCINGNLIDKKGKTYKADLFFPVLHGTFGEDGCVQGLFETLGVKYVGCKVLASALAMNKELSKEIAIKAKIPVLPWFSLNKNEKFDRKAILRNAKKLSYPVFVKPNSLGSSIGITKVNKESELFPAIKKAFNFENHILVEKGIDNAREVFCAIIEIKPNTFKASACGELIQSGSEFFDYETKYHNPHGCDMEIPAKLSKSLQNKLQEYTKKFFMAPGGTGLSRIDFLISKDGKKAYFSEINTLPGLSKTSLFPNLLKEGGLPYTRLLEILVKTALNRG